MTIQTLLLYGKRIIPDINIYNHMFISGWNRDISRIQCSLVVPNTNTTAVGPILPILAVIHVVSQGKKKKLIVFVSIC